MTLKFYVATMVFSNQDAKANTKHLDIIIKNMMDRINGDNGELMTMSQSQSDDRLVITIAYETQEQKWISDEPPE